LINEKEYLALIDEIRTRIGSAQRRAIRAVNSELVELYWDIGRLIDEHSEWGNRFIEKLSQDIHQAYPEARGFSVRNLKYMQAFAREYPDRSIVQSLPAQLTWTHHVLLLDKVKDRSVRLWYAQQAAVDGLSVRALEDRIDRHAYERQVVPAKATNFSKRLPTIQAALAEELLKDPYIFDFISARDGMVEREIQSELVQHVSRLLMELGVGFAFVGENYHMEVSGDDFFIDLLFYHLRLRCYVVVELKTGKFKPEYAGQLNFYVSAVDDLLRDKTDQPTIGLLLCKDKRGLIAEYAFKDIRKPIGVSEYRLFGTLPEEYESLLPSPADIESRLGLAMTERKHGR